MSFILRFEIPLCMHWVLCRCRSFLALILAVAVNQGIPGRAFFRAAFYIPAITSSVVTSVIFLWIYSKTGLLNYLLSAFGIEGPDWIGSPRYALGSIMALNVWSTSGYFMIAFLAGLQGIPKALYEAAEIDGAGAWRKVLGCYGAQFASDHFFRCDTRSHRLFSGL